jgi:hypothetical protein
MSKYRKAETFTKYLSLVYGIVLTIFMVIVFVPKIIGKFIEDGISFFMEIIESFISWDNPTPFFFTYIIGYAIIWWKPLWGSIIIIFGSIFYIIKSGTDGPLIFASPAFMLGILYLLHYFLAKKQY